MAADALEQQVAALLAAPPGTATQRFFQQVTRASGPGLEVRLDAGDGKGKGVFATQDFAEGSVLIHEPPLVGIQHTANRPVAQVCAHCFQYVGSLEHQIATRLLTEHTSIAEGSEEEEESSSDDGSSTSSQHGTAGVPEGLALALLSGDIQLPLAERINLPVEAVPCPGGCEEDSYCSARCSEVAWRQYHSVLCTGGGQAAGPAAQGKGKAAASEASAAEAERRQRAAAMAEFNEHADETNDVFRLAAKVVATVLLQARRLLEQGAAAGSGGSSSEAPGASSSSSSSSRAAGAGSGAGPEQCWVALQAAWEPFAMGHKAVWWESVAVPEDVADEAEFRLSLQQLSADSLELLRAALYDARFPALFDLRVWGSIIGMFELNNLNLFVPSPAQRWANLLEELPEGEREAAQEEAGPILEAVQHWEEDGCEGNAFYSLQACVNHSCAPNAHAFKRDEDTDGLAVILALHDIKAGEEVTISYVDEDAPLQERQADLADYGFTCHCDKCAAEQLAAELLTG